MHLRDVALLIGEIAVGAVVALLPLLTLAGGLRGRTDAAPEQRINEFALGNEPVQIYET
jgi:hypothetical protein